MSVQDSIAINFAPLPSLVFQCVGCRVIVGDSTELACTMTRGSLRLVVLRAATEVIVDRASATSNSGPEGTYFQVHCNSCGSTLGRLYTRADGLECLVNKFALDASRCMSYELGSSEIRVLGQAEADMAGAAEATPGDMQPTAADAQTALAELAAKIELLESQLTQMQGIVMQHEAQLQQLPGCHDQRLQPVGHGGLPAAAGEAFASDLQYQSHIRTSMGAG